MYEKGAADTASSPMFDAVLEKKTADGKPAYNRTVERFTDTADPVALIRNALTAQQDQNTVVVSTGSAANLLGVLALPEGKSLIRKKVRTLVLGGSADTKLLAEWPSPIVVVGEEIGQSCPFPAVSIEQDFAWAANHPLVDAYRAAMPMPYDTPTTGMLALQYAAHPDETYFTLAGSGTPRRLTVDVVQKDRVIQTLRQLVSAKPPEPRRGRGGNE
jgi:hypothetical protein